MRPVHLLLMLVVLMPFTGCLGDNESTSEAIGTYTVESTLSILEIEAKSAYYQDDQGVDWSV